MSDPITPLTLEQVRAAQVDVVQEGWLRRSLVAVDQAVNVIVLKGQPDETISSHAARAATEGKWWGRTLSRILNWFQPDHGAEAEAGDLQRAQNVEQIEKNSGNLE